MGNQPAQSSKSSSDDSIDLPTYNTPIEVSIIHARTALGQAEADKATSIIKQVFPNATICL
jgi:hypothetical protein